MKTFDIEYDTDPVSEFIFTGRQGEEAQRVGVVRAFRFRFIQGTDYLPKYIQESIKQAGFKAVYLGGTTYKYSVFGLVPNKEVAP